MKKHKCLIIDDEQLARELIMSHLQNLDQFEVIAMCESALEASQYLSDHDIDLIFLDIEMPVLRGTDFYKNLNNAPKVIFTTAYRDYAVDGFDLDAVDYLLKPITFARFFKSIERYLSLQKSRKKEADPSVPQDKGKEYFFVRSDRKDVKIVFDEILYIQSLKDYVQIFTKDKKITVKDSITNIAESLGNDFIRVHRSYIVNQQKITAFTKHDIELGEIEIPIGESFKDNFFDRKV